MPVEWGQEYPGQPAMVYDYATGKFRETTFDEAWSREQYYRAHLPIYPHMDWGYSMGEWEELMAGGGAIGALYGSGFTAEQLRNKALEDTEAFIEDLFSRMQSPNQINQVRDVLAAVGVTRDALDKAFGTGVYTTGITPFIPTAPTAVSTSERLLLSEPTGQEIIQSIYEEAKYSPEARNLVDILGITPPREAFVTPVGQDIVDLIPEKPQGTFLPMIGLVKSLTAEQKEAAPAWVKAFASGLGDVYSSAAGAAMWLGYSNVGEGLSIEAERLYREYKYTPRMITGDFELTNLVNPDWWYNNVGLTISRAGAFAIALAPLAVGGFYGGAAIAGAVGLAGIWTAIVGAAVSGVLSRGAESALEAGGQYNDAIARGKTEAEAKAEANEVFRNNMILAGADAWEIAIALAPTPKWVPMALMNSGLVRVARIGGKMVIVGLSEGGEEVYQDMVQRRARGEDWQLDPISKEVFAIGAIMGMGMGLGGDVITSIVAKARQNMSSGLRTELDKQTAAFRGFEYSKEQAELRALDVISQTKEGQKALADAIKEVRGGVPISESAVKPQAKPPEITIPKAEAATPTARISQGYYRSGDIFTTPTGNVELDFYATRENKWVVTNVETQEQQRLETSQIDEAIKSKEWVYKPKTEEGVIVPKAETGMPKVVPEVVTVEGIPTPVPTRVASPPEGSASKRVFDRIQIEPEGTSLIDKIRSGWHSFNVHMVDDLFAIKKLVDQSRKGGVELSITENPYLMARLLRGIAGKTNVFLEKGTFGVKFWKMEKGKAVPNFTGESLETILQEVKEPTAWRDFSTYLVSQRAIELNKHNIETGVELADAQASISELEDKYPRFPELAQRIYAYQSRLLDYIEESGLISHELREKLSAKYQAYVPFYRVFNELQAKGFMGKKMANIAKPIKRIKGSEREIINPLESIVKNTYVLINSADRNQIGIMLANLVDKNPEIVEVFERVKTPMAKVAGVSAKDLGIEVEGLTNEDAEAVVDVFRPSFFVRGDEVTVLIDGKKKYFKVDSDLRDALLNLDRETLGTIGKILGAPARWLRAGATLSPDFMIRNPARDQLTAFAYSKYGFLPGIDFIKGLASILKKDDAYQLYRASGAEHSMLVSMDRQYLSKTFKELIQGRGFTFYVKNPMELLRIVSELGEKATRLGEFKAGIRRGAIPLEAGYSARSVTLDFAQAGTTAHAINTLAAFFNANIRGWGWMISNFKEYPARTSLKVFVGITLPSILLYLANKDDDRWKEIPQWQKDLFWIVLTKDNIYRIPKPFELGILFGSVPERFLEWLDNEDPKLFKDVLWNLVEAGTPNPLPTGIMPILEWLTNYSFFRGSSIVPESRQDMPPELQYVSWTSAFSKKIGELLNLSPAKIDNLINGYTAGLGRYAVDILDKILKGTGISPDIPEPSATLADLPVIKAFVVRNPYGSSGASVDRFYDILSEFEAGEKYLKEMLELGEQAKFDAYKAGHPELLFFMDFERDTFYSATARYLRSVARDLTELRNKQDEIYNSPDISSEEKRRLIDEIDKLKTELATKALSMIQGEMPSVLQNQINESINKLGTVLEDTPLLEPDIYDMRKLRAEFGSILEGATAADLKNLPGIDPLAYSFLAVRDIEKQIGSILNKKIYEISPDLKEGVTFEEYYQSWLNGIFRDDVLSNLPRRQLELLREYYKLDKAEQAKFLEENPELAINPRTEWLKSHPLENALLAIWGQAKVLSLEAYNQMKLLLRQLDIPTSGLPKLSLPPEGSIKNYFTYEGLVELGKANSWEAQLIIAEDENLRIFLDREMPETPVSLLKMLVANRANFDKYDTYIASTDEGAEARQEMLFSVLPDAGPGTLTAFGKAHYYKEAYSQGYSEENWGKFAEYSSLPIWGSWRDRFLLDPANANFYHEYMFDVGDGHAAVDPAAVKPIERDLLYGKYIDQFSSWDDTKGMSPEGVKAFHERLMGITKDGMTFREVRYRIEAYDAGFPVELIDDYAGYYMALETTLKKPEDWKYEDWYEDDWWLQKHDEFCQAMVDLKLWKELPNFDKVPTRRVFGLYQDYLDTPEGNERMQFRIDNPKLDNWLVKAKDYKPATAPGMTGATGSQQYLHWLEEQGLLEEWMKRFLA